VKDLKEPIIYYNGKFLKESEVSLSPYNRGLHFGDGVFETLRVYSGRVFRLESHIKRLFKGLDALGLENKADVPVIEEAVKGLICENSLTEAALKIIAFREECPGLDPVPGLKACYLITSSPFDFKRKKYCGKGISAAIVSIRRNQSSPHVFIKSLNYLENILGRREAHDKGYDEAVFLNNYEMVTEGSISNLFIIKDSVLFTPPEDAGILKGITRDVVFEIAKDLGMKCCEESFKADYVLTVDEAFMTNSLMEIMPLREIDGQILGDTCLGSKTSDFMRRYREKVEQEVLGCL
jgi:branched-chain amino acid aminotransferase